MKLHGIAGGILLIASGLAGCAGFNGESAASASDKTYTLSWAESGRVSKRSLDELEALGSRQMSSHYFDRAMQYSNSRFRSISFDALLKQFPSGSADAVLLNCFDDYQGLISIEDIGRYRLELATKIYLAPGVEPPHWLNPLLILVPDGVDAPFQERFMTANIRELRFVKLEHYYAPLNRVVEDYPATAQGLKKFKDNCVYCHSVKGVGGNKGGSLFQKFDFSKGADRENFKEQFLGFHHKDNADKQNLEQFVDDLGLGEIAGFLQKLAL